MFNDARLLDRPLLNQKNNTKNVLVLHNSHLNNDEVKGSFKFALKHSEKVNEIFSINRTPKARYSKCL
ncbi:poly (glycerol-phosphate) alpha-glucosyltransferase [Staphylococcus gallinarum]|uniref:Poly (Glycerol-phosphate) alpha-glucosyltransferase n=1 Tax=Staphylococcus gallinarum TaxID=1293 RepID=A0A380FLJ7_STAGA|nr:poly (glycerol-phosphate) alpha-glucosyltransferase [Staphylococcus gallinarum]